MPGRRIDPPQLTISRPDESGSAIDPLDRAGNLLCRELTCAPAAIEHQPFLRQLRSQRRLSRSTTDPRRVVQLTYLIAPPRRVEQQLSGRRPPERRPAEITEGEFTRIPRLHR